MGKETYLEKAFKLLNNRIDALYQMKDEMKSFLFVKWHKYSVEELYDSNEYQSIESATEKIADDMNNWEQNKELDFGTRNTYNVNRDLLEDRLILLNRAIENREPTMWEKIGSFFKALVNFVVTKLPKLWNGLILGADYLKNVKVIGPICKILIAFDKRVRKFLLPQKKKFITDESKK